MATIGRIVAILFLCWDAAFLVAAPPVPRLESLAPVWLQRGTTNDVTLRGESLKSVSTLHLSGAGLFGTLQPQPPPAVTLESSSGGLSSAPIEAGKTVRAQIIVAPDTALGSHELRVSGPQGVSNPIAFQVSDLPELSESSPDSTQTEAPLYPTPCAISGVISASAESDFFRFKLKAGESILFDVQANRTGSPLDPTLFLLDASGKELLRSEDVNGLDPMMTFIPPADGEYALKISDARYQGGGDYRYRLLAGHIPHLDYLFPLGARRGSTVELQFFGHHLEGADKLRLSIASDAPLGQQEIRARTAQGHSNPLAFETSDLPEMFESEPNNSIDKANAVSVPVVINGRIGSASDMDIFRVKSQQDQRLVVEVEARKFGSPLDAFLTLSDSNGGVISRNDDANGPDSRIEFDARKDTDYLLTLKDLTDRGGERFSYRMVVRSPETRPDFAVRTSGGRFRIARGGTLAIRCDLDRRNGFDGLVRVSAIGLPAGVTASVLTLGPTLNFGWIILTATTDGITGHFPLSLNSTGEMSGSPVVRPVQLPETGWLTILPMSPLTVDVGTSAVVTEQNGHATVDVGVIRRNGFNGEIKVLAEAMEGVEISELVLPPGLSRGQLKIHPAYTAPIGVRPLMVRAEAKVEGDGEVEYAPTMVPVTVQPIPMFLTAMLPGSSFFRTDPVKLSAVALPTHSTSAANSTEFVVKVDRRGLTGEINLALEGLPKGVTATINPIAPNAREASIKLTVSDQAETGKEFTFSVAGSATYQDRIWRQNTQTVSLMIAAPEKESAPVKAQTSDVPHPSPVVSK